MADGETKQAALEMAERVAHEWIEMAKVMGRPLPEPRGRLMFV